MEEKAKLIMNDNEDKSLRILNLDNTNKTLKRSGDADENRFVSVMVATEFSWPSI